MVPGGLGLATNLVTSFPPWSVHSKFKASVTSGGVSNASTQFPDPLQESVASQGWSLIVPTHVVPAALKPLSWQPPPEQVSWFVHCVPASPQEVPSATWFSWQVPDPLQVSAASHWPLDELPQAVPALLNPLSWQAPEEQVSWFVHSVPESPQEVPLATWFRWQVPDPLQVSAASDWALDELPQVVPEALNPLSWHAPARQVSWLVHAVPASPQLVPSATWFTWQVPAPLHVSAASHASLDPVPQAVPDALKPLSWHAPARQVSWLVHYVPVSPQLQPSAT